MNKHHRHFLQVVSKNPKNVVHSALLSSSEFDPALYHEELIRNEYLSKFPIRRSAPDYTIKIGNSTQKFVTITLEVKTHPHLAYASSMSLCLLSVVIVIVFSLMFFVYLNGFVFF